MPSKYFHVDGGAVLVHHRGVTTLPGAPPDTSTGRAVVCLHDAAGNGHDFDPLLDALDGRHSPLSYDQPGHGRSGGLDSLGRIDLMAAHLGTLVASLGLESPVLVGDGLGAAVALEAALTDPSVVGALVLCGGATSKFALAEDAVATLEAITAGRARREFDTTGYAPDTPREVYQRAFGEWVKTDPRATLGDRRAQVAWDVTGRVGEVACPVLVVTGEHEEAESVAAATALAEALSAGRQATLAGAGRRGVYERPEALADLIDGFATEVMS